MSDISDSSLRGDDNDDIVAEYENRESDNEDAGGNISGDAGENSQDQEDQETEARRVDPKTSRKRVTLNPLPKLNTQRLKGPKGIQTIEKYFEGFKFHGRGHEKMDLNRVMKRLEHWSHRLFPKLHFDDFLERLEQLGAKRDLQTFIKKYRMDEITPDDGVVPPEYMNDDSDKEEESGPIDEFDMLIAEEIEKQKQVAHNNSAFDDLLRASNKGTHNKTGLSQTLPASSQENPPASNKPAAAPELSDEIKDRIERNRQQAIQRRLARLEAMQEEAKRKKLEESESTNVLSKPSADSSNNNDHLREEENKSPNVIQDNTERNINNADDEKKTSPLKEIVSITESTTDSAFMKSLE